ncbi:MAG: YdbH domain-containing protein [Nitrospira sp.]|nr:YdbH domain-containing protein [Nitrospira sp.]MCP9442577.1 YdbH domain-containing protein [Nitrospira sp.]
MNKRPAFFSGETFAQRYQFPLFWGLIILAGLYLLLPLGASYLLARGLSRYGYEHVIVQLGYPGFGGIHVPVVSLQQNLGGEKLLVSLTDAEIRYSLPQLVRGHVDSIFLPDVAVQVLTTHRQAADEAGDVTESEEDDELPWSFLTVNDLLHRLPILPFDELRLDRVSVFREKATGPLRKVTISGLIRYRHREVDGHLSFQGQNTVSYGLTVSGSSASTWSAELVSQRLHTIPIISWKSQAHSSGEQIQVAGQLDVNVRELAPFIALLVPIGPDLGKVTGRVTVQWAGTAAADTALTTLWRDPRTRLEGGVTASITLPALKGVASDISIAYQGTFTGDAKEVVWTLEPGVPLAAMINGQASFFPETLRNIVPRGNQPVRIELSQPLHGVVYWSESPVRMVVVSPVRVRYGRAPESFVVEAEASHVEWKGGALSTLEGTYRVLGSFPRAVAETLFAHEVSADIRGSLRIKRGKVQGTMFSSSSVKVRRIEREAVLIPNAVFQWQDSFPFHCETAVLRCSGGPATMGVQIPSLRVMGREVHMAQGLLTLQLAELAGRSWHTQGKFLLQGVSPNLLPWKIQPTDWKGRFLANQAGIKADLHIDAPFQDRLVFAEIDQPLTTGEGMLHATIGPVAFDGAEHRLSNLVTKMPWPVEVVEGRVASTLDVLWVGGWGNQGEEFRVMSGTGTVVVEKLSGRYEDSVFKNATTTMTIRAGGPSAAVTVEPAQVSVASIRSGIEITNCSARIGGTWRLADASPIFELSTVRCEAFGGSITSDGWTVDQTRSQYQMTFSLHDLDLAKILSIEPNRGLKGTGTLNGTLPIVITPSGVTVKDGLLIASPSGGIISYAASEDSLKSLAETNAELHLVAQALSNFHYTVLRTGVDYAENGMLLLTARLEGKNPDLKTVPPINLNLTVQEHIPSLLKSLRVVEELERTVERKFKRP